MERRLENIRRRIDYLYPEGKDTIYKRIERMLKEAKKELSILDTGELFSEKDIVLICYGDHLLKDGEEPLITLRHFLTKYCRDIFNRVHILPFFPYSSDDGFSVKDHYMVDPRLGDWRDVREIGKDFSLMYDLVVNHVSSESEWFKRFLRQDEDFKDYFISFIEPPDISSVFRPRTSPLLTEFNTVEGKRFLWTTFSADQIDLNFKNPEVLIEAVGILLHYLKNGARMIRLDAIGFLWKKLGTECIHLKETHEVVKLLRDVIEFISEDIWMITETNVPHESNVSYFGDGYDEAHLVYNFTLPPLLLYTLHSGNTRKFNEWVSSLSLPSEKTSFFNFTASHDGIGLTPLKGIISEEEIRKLADHIVDMGGKVSYRKVIGEYPEPYELNVVFLDALGKDVDRFLMSQAIQVSLQGVPGIYLNSLIGAENWVEGIEEHGHNRAINRQKFNYGDLVSELAQSGSIKNKVFFGLKHLLEIRRQELSFSPYSTQKVIEMGDDIFALLRYGKDDKVLCIYNVSFDPQQIDRGIVKSILGDEGKQMDILSNRKFDYNLGKNGFVWLKVE